MRPGIWRLHAAAARVLDKMDLQLHGLRAIVTGGASGIAKAIALGLASEGATITILDRADPEVTLAAARGRGATAHGRLVDLADRPAAEIAARQAVDTMGGLDLLVNAAATTRHEEITRLTPEGWQLSLDTNLAACAWICKEAARTFVAQRSGVILVIGSTVIHNPAYRELSYRVSKVGLRAVVETLAIELAPHGVRVNMLTPGAVSTSLVANVSSDVRARTVREIPLRREAAPEELVPTALLLLSDQLSRYTTGTEVLVDGGLHLRPLPTLDDAELAALNDL